MFLAKLRNPSACAANKVDDTGVERMTALRVLTFRFLAVLVGLAEGEKTG